jgi:HK97 family phage major capsid protein
MIGGQPDGRLLAAAASTYGNESSGTDGGFAVPPDFLAAISEKAFGEDSLFARTDQQPVSGNSLTFPTDMDTPWGSGGIQAFWTGEAAAITQSKPVLEDITVRLHKLSCLVPVTDELLEDATAMGSYVSRKAGEKIDYKVSDAIVNGNGVGQPLGFRNSAVMIEQAAESSQVADTIVAGNVVKMMSRLPVQSRRTAIWLIHPDAEPQLPLMTIGEQPVYMPPGGLRDSPFGHLLGRPVIPHQTCQTVGDEGDIVLADLSQYLTAVKAGGVRSQTSIHLWFDQGITAFRFDLRVAGQPWWSETTTSKNGDFTMSPFVTLAVRT